MHKKLISSSLLAAVGTVLPASIAGAQTVLYSDQGLFETDAAGLSYAQMYVETLEDNTIGGAYAMITPPLTYGVANNGFPNGLSAPDLSITSGFGNLFALRPNASYWPNIASTVVGTNSEPDHTILQFGGDGAMAMGFQVQGIQSFTTGYPDEIVYTIFDTAGGVIATGNFATPTSDIGAFFGVISNTAVGSIDINGIRFGSMDTQEYVDDIQAWNPEPLEGDINGDGCVDIQDALLLFGSWGPCEGDCPADLNGDGEVGIWDFLILLISWFHNWPCA